VGFAPGGEAEEVAEAVVGHGRWEWRKTTPLAIGRLS
jgi:hypothetical protein